jgi:hypothetical protein
MKRARRHIAAWLAILGIVFAQLAVAAYACPGMPPPQDSAVPAIPCAEMDMDAPALCERHCQGQDQQAGPGDITPAPFVATFASPLPALDPPRPKGFTRAPPRPAASPPLAFQHRFRL